MTWLLSYALFGAAALHPSMRSLAEARRAPVLRSAPWRIGLLAAALISAPTVLFVQHERGVQLTFRSSSRWRRRSLSSSSRVSRGSCAHLSGSASASERRRVALATQNVQLLEADRLKDEFVALISHDVRTPLTSIIGYVELVAGRGTQPPLDGERRKYLDIVSRSSERLMRIVDDLLFVARLQAGRLELEPSKLDLAVIAPVRRGGAAPRGAERVGALVASATNTCRSRPIAAGCSSSSTISSRTRSSSHRKAAESTFAPLRTPDGAVLEVSDTGIGLAQRSSSSLFDRFFRSDQQ